MNLNDKLSVLTNTRSIVSINTPKEVNEVKEIADPETHSCDFGEGACGEPLAPQRLVVDFTPNEEDTEFIQKKCCAFWDFITSCPELENFIVLPEPNISDRKSRPSDIELASIKQPKTHEPQQEPAKSAVSMIEFVEEKGSKVCKKCNVQSSLEKQAKIPSEDVQEMCRELRDWDVQHPKSMDPPGHPPSLDLL